MWGGGECRIFKRYIFRVNAKVTQHHQPCSYSPSFESVYKEAMKAKEDSSKRKQKESSEPKLASVGEKGTHHDPNSVQAQKLTHAVEYFITLHIII